MMREPATSTHVSRPACSSTVCVRTDLHALVLFHISVKKLVLTREHTTFRSERLCPHPSDHTLPAGSLLSLKAAGTPWAPVGASGRMEAWTQEGLLTGPAPHSQPPALSQLVSLYLGRSHFLWKEPATMSWLEENVREVLQAVDAGDPAVEVCESR